jgi:hypothetical protein
VPRLAQEALKLNEADTQKKFMDDLKENGQHRAFIADLVSVVGMPDAEKKQALADAAAEPGRALGAIVAAANRDQDARDAKDRLIKLLGKQPEALLVKDYNLDQEAGFDVRTRLATIKALPGETQKHYELQLLLTAVDNNVETGTSKRGGGTEATPVGPFTFLVVSEDELNAEILRQERKLHGLLKDSVDQLKGRKITLDAEIANLAQPGPNLPATLARVDQTRKSLRETRDISRAVLDKYVVILEEMIFNRFEIDKKESDRKRIPDTKNLIVEPLRDLTQKNEGDFDVVGRNGDSLYKEIDEDLLKVKQAGKAPDAGLAELLEKRRPEHLKSAERFSRDTQHVINRLEKVLDAMRDIGDKNKLVEMLVRIEAARRENHIRFRQWEEEELRKLRDLFGDPKEEGPKNK